MLCGSNPERGNQEQPGSAQGTCIRPFWKANQNIPRGEQPRYTNFQNPKLTSWRHGLCWENLRVTGEYLVLQVSSKSELMRSLTPVLQPAAESKQNQVGQPTTERRRRGLRNRSRNRHSYQPFLLGRMQIFVSNFMLLSVFHIWMYIYTLNQKH